MVERPVPAESIAGRINRLKTDLTREIVVQREISHEEYAISETGSGHGMSTWDFSAGDSFVPRRKEIDQERIAKPDTERREAARQELLQIYDSAETSKVQMQAGMALGYSRFRILRERLLS